MSAVRRQCRCGAPLPPDNGSGSVKCRACGIIISLSEASEVRATPGPPRPATPTTASPPRPRTAPQPIIPRRSAPPAVSVPETKPVEATRSGPRPAAPPQGGDLSQPLSARLIGQPAAKRERATKFNCGCGQVLHSKRLPGSRVMCPACGQVLDVPGQDMVSRSVEALDVCEPSIVVYFRCQCGETLRAEEGVGSSVMCLNCGRDAAAPASGKKALQFQCSCGAILETDETAGSEITCPACNKDVLVPAVEEGKG